MDKLPLDRRLRRRQRWRKFFFVVALVLVALAVWSLDERAPDVSDLAPTPRQLPDDQNAYLVIEKAVKAVKFDSWGLSSEESEIYNAMLRGESWDNAKAATWLTATDELWPLLAQAAALPSGQAPINDPTSRHPDLPFSETYSLAQLSIIRGWSQFYAGQPETGLETILISLRVAHRLEESRGGWNTYGIGGRLSMLIEQSLTAMAGRKETSAAALHYALEVLAQTQPTAGECVQNLYAIYQANSLALDDLQQDKSSTVFRGRPLPYIFKYGINWPLLFKPHKSQRVLAEDFRAALKLREANWADIEAFCATEKERFFGIGWRRFNPDNFFGRCLLTFSELSPQPSYLLQYRIKERSTRSATEAFLALRLYYVEHGELPATLDPLVPAYLSAVPLDYYDRAPIRYSRDYFAVWSIGPDHFAVTSVNPASDDTSSEIYYRLDFAAPPKPTPVKAPVEPAPAEPPPAAP